MRATWANVCSSIDKMKSQFTYIALLLASILMWSCMKRTVKVPSTMISEAKMVPILVDIHIAEGARNGSLILGDTNNIADYYAKIYEKHGITEAQFKQSFSFYSKETTLFIPIYEKVLDSLKIQGELLAKKGVELDYGD